VNVSLASHNWLGKLKGEPGLVLPVKQCRLF
jgi:hypothetical protein